MKRCCTGGVLRFWGNGELLQPRRPHHPLGPRGHTGPFLARPALSEGQHASNLSGRLVPVGRAQLNHVLLRGFGLRLPAARQDGFSGSLAHSSRTRGGQGTW